MSPTDALNPAHRARPATLEEDPIAYQARVRPDETAMVDAATGWGLSYSALDRLITAYVAALLDRSGGQLVGQRIAVLGRNSVAQVALALACQRGGAVFVPLNWRLTALELGVLLSDAAPVLLIYGPEFAATALEAADERHALQTLSLDDLAAEVDELRSSDRPAPAEMPADAPCTLLYTSGTTGRPKGVIITRSGAFYACLNMAVVGEIGPTTVMLCDAPLFHTVGLLAVARTTLMAGGRLVMSERFVPATTLARLSDPTLGVTHFFGVPQMAAALRQDPAYADADLSRLKAIFTGGAPLPPSLVEAFLADGLTLVNGYGMSEAGTIMHMPLDPQTTRRHPGAIGFPAPTLQTRIVGADGHDVAVGQDGELWIKGSAVTPGYWGQPEATARVFTDGWFHTGDVARQDGEGLHRLLDRRKDMYISGGENVYPAEVEAVLLSHPDVLDAAVIGAPHPRWDECGVAFVVSRTGAATSAAEILAHLDGRLARYKHPAHITFVKALTRTASGKVRKDELRRLHAASLIPST
ncbi:MAG: AMP-binding protein [Caulobacteraceae bacterium]